MIWSNIAGSKFAKAFLVSPVVSFFSFFSFSFPSWVPPCSLVFLRRWLQQPFEQLSLHDVAVINNLFVGQENSRRLRVPCCQYFLDSITVFLFHIKLISSESSFWKNRFAKPNYHIPSPSHPFLAYRAEGKCSLVILGWCKNNIRSVVGGIVS